MGFMCDCPLAVLSRVSASGLAFLVKSWRSLIPVFKRVGREATLVYVPRLVVPPLRLGRQFHPERRYDSLGMCQI